MQASVGWKWKAGDCPPQTGCSTCKSSLQEAISVRLHLPTTKLGGMCKKLEKFLLPHGRPSDDRSFAFSSRVPSKAAKIKALKLWKYLRGNEKRVGPLENNISA